MGIREARTRTLRVPWVNASAYGSSNRRVAGGRCDSKARCRAMVAAVKLDLSLTGSGHPLAVGHDGDLGRGRSQALRELARPSTYGDLSPSLPRIEQMEANDASQGVL